MINMPYGGGSQFDENDLIAYIRESGRDYIVTGGCNCALIAHTKPQSLDVWLRQRPGIRNPDTRQTCQELIDNLVVTGFFIEEDGLMCPDSEHLCNGVCLSVNQLS